MPTAASAAAPNGTLKTSEVLRRLAVNRHTLYALISRGRIKPPARNEAGGFLWTAADVEAARAELARTERRRHSGTIHELIEKAAGEPAVREWLNRLLAGETAGVKRQARATTG